jgi:hypothetical protein
VRLPRLLAAAREPIGGECPRPPCASLTVADTRAVFAAGEVTPQAREATDERSAEIVAAPELGLAMLDEFSGYARGPGRVAGSEGCACGVGCSVGLGPPAAS